MKLRALSLLLGLSLAATAAHATVYSLPGDPINGFDTDSVKVSPGSFLDDWTFALPGGSGQFDVNAFQIKFHSTYNLVGTTLELLQGPVGLGTLIGAPVMMTQNTDGFSYNNLAAGNYYFQIAGLADGSLGGKYEVQAVSEVPEPGTMALLGIGAVALIFALRSKSTGGMSQFA